jgi:hypothetical protein
MGLTDRVRQRVDRLWDSDEVDMMGQKAVRPDLNVVGIA